MHRPTDTSTSAIPTADDVPTAGDLPTAGDVVELYRAVVRDGLAAHASSLQRLERAAGEIGADPALARLLDDRTAPDAIRVRALARLAGQWPSATGISSTFHRLLAQWNAHQDLRSTGSADLTELATSRWRLDQARRDHLAVRRARRVQPAG